MCCLWRRHFRGEKKKKARAEALPLKGSFKIARLPIQGKLSSEKNNSLEKSHRKRFQRRRGLSAGQIFFVQKGRKPCLDSAPMSKYKGNAAEGCEPGSGSSFLHISLNRKGGLVGWPEEGLPIFL